MGDLDLDVTGKRFTRRWFRTRNMGAFAANVFPRFAGKPTVYLELGVFEGMSMLWMMQQVLTHPASRAVGIDPWGMVTKISEQEMEWVHHRAVENLSQYSDRCRLIRGTSAEILRVMNGRRGFAGISPGSVDISMVDGNHNALAVLDDARRVCKLLKPGGWMLFDDVRGTVKNKPDSVEDGLRMFLNEVGDGMRLVWESRFMEAYEKT